MVFLSMAAHGAFRNHKFVAITADRQWSSQSEDKIYSVEVASSFEVYIYHTKRNKHLEEYNVLRRVDGGWKVQERKLSGSALLGPTN